MASVEEEGCNQGLAVGDTLLEVGGTPVEGMSLSKVERMVRQTKSKALSLLVEREEDLRRLRPKVSNDAEPNNKKNPNTEQDPPSQLKTRTSSNIYLEEGSKQL